MFLAIALIIALAIAIFAVNNSTTVTLSFLMWQFQASLVVVILGSAALGATVVALLGLLRQISMNFKLWDLRARLRKAENEHSALLDKLSKAEQALMEARQEIEQLKAQPKPTQGETAQE